jgi:quercetin dioxygenase-like cupin family protein
MNEDQRTPPRERFAGHEHLFDLTTEGDRLRAESRDAYDGHRQITLFRGDDVSIVLFDFDAGGFLKDHAADGHVTVHVLSGDIRMTTATEDYPMSAGSLLVLKPGVTHDVRAETESRVLLTVRLDQAQDQRS